MSKYLDIDDVCAEHPVALKQLRELREEPLDMLQDLMYFDTVPQEYKELINKIWGCEFQQEEE